MGGRDLMAGVATMTSREIAELTGSPHDSVLKTVRRLNAEGVVSGNETPYKHEQNGQMAEDCLNPKDFWLTVDQLRAEVNYDPETGIFTRIRDAASMARAGDIAGSIRTSSAGKSYIAIMVCGITYAAHRLAFVYMGHPLPPQVDHENGNGLDNRWRNLRASDNAKNSKNQRLRKSNTSGQMGVCWHKKSNQWAISIRSNGKRISLGYRKQFADAVAVRKAAEQLYGYDKNHGQDRPLYAAGEWAKHQISNRDGSQA